jgi:hypothetical protein
MPHATISAGERPQTYDLDSPATGTGIKVGMKQMKWEGGWTEYIWLLMEK